jgi:hypothetical protein
VSRGGRSSVRAYAPFLAALAFIAGAALGLPLSAAGAQNVHGTVTDAKTHAPVNGAIVALLDENSRAVAATLASDSGSYALRAPAPGTFRLRVERVGFRNTLTPPFALGDGESREYPLEVGGDAVALNAVKIVADKKCVVRPNAGLAAAELWNEARKALEATKLNQAQRVFTVRVRKTERALDPRTLAERRTTSFEQESQTISPFTSVPMDTIARYGFVRMDRDSSEWNAPDADVLLSDQFLDGHCLMALPLAGGLVGLMFEPVSGVRLPDVKGVLWFDPQSAELRFMTYQYVNVALDVPLEKTGGRIDFMKLQNGRWIVKRWYIRMPIVVLHRNPPVVPGGMVQEYQEITEIREAGGEVLEIGAKGRAGANVASVVGTVFDSVRGQPVSGARVFVSGTARASVSGAGGGFQIDSVPPGQHVVSMVLPRLDSLLVEPPAMDVALSGGVRTTTHFAVPSLETLALERCGMDRLPEKSAMVVGVVRDSLTGRPVTDVAVRAAFQDVQGRTTSDLMVSNRTMEARTTERGHYALCALPLERPVTVRVLRDGTSSAARTLRLEARDVMRVDLLAPPKP